MKTLGLALLLAAGGYIVGVLLGVALVNLFSSPKPDRSMEAVMTGFFVAGPAVALLTFVGALIYHGSRR